MKKDPCPMKCCKREAASAKPQQKETANLCRTLNCIDPATTSTLNTAQTNFAPMLFILKNFAFFQFLFAQPAKEKAQPIFAFEKRLKTFQSKYIQNLSLLI